MMRVTLDVSLSHGKFHFHVLCSLCFFFSILQPATGCQLCKCENVYSSLTCATCFCLSLPADADNSHLFNCFTVAARLFNVHFVDVAHFVILQCLRRWCYATLNSDAVWLQHCIGQSICYLPMLNLCIKLTRWAKNKILIMCSLELYATHTERESGKSGRGRDHKYQVHKKSCCHILFHCKFLISLHPIPVAKIRINLSVPANVNVDLVCAVVSTDCRTPAT